MKRHSLPIVLLTLTLAGTPAGGDSQADDIPDGAKPSVTVFPAALAPHKLPDDYAKRVGAVIATFLEKAGLEELEVVDTMFSPPETDKIDEIAEAFGKQVRGTPIKTDYAVFTQFLGTPKTSVNEIRTIVVDKAGKVILAESAGKEQFEKAKPRPHDPMTCCMFVSRRLQKLWDLEDPLRPNAPEGKMARFWRQDAGIPAKDELDAMTNRLATLKENIQKATFTVYPIHMARQSDRQCTVELVAMINKSGLCKAEISNTDPALKIAAHSNEQKVLWDTARAFRDFVKHNPPTTDYAVYADYGTDGAKFHYMHAVICDKLGDLVFIDMQNSHQKDFQRVAPKSSTDGNRLLFKRLQSRLGKS